MTTIGGYLDVSFNDQLATLSMPALRAINERRLTKPSDVFLSDNPRLECQAEMLAAQLRANGFAGTIQIEPKKSQCEAASFGRSEDHQVARVRRRPPDHEPRLDALREEALAKRALAGAHRRAAGVVMDGLLNTCGGPPSRGR